MATPSPVIINQSRAALQSAEPKTAIEIRNAALEQEPSPRDVETLRILELILTRTPELLADVPAEILQPLRIAAALMELWGTTDIPEYILIDPDFDQRFTAPAIGHMLHSHACFLKKLEEFRSVGIKRVELLGSKDTTDCKACREADGETFTIDSVPELPLAACQCKSEYGCRLMVIAENLKS